MTSIAQLSTLAVALLTVLRDLSVDAGGAPFRAGHRSLAAAVGCSAGWVPRLMAELETAGRLRRTPHKNTYLLQLIDQQPDATDRSLIDHSAPPPAATDRSVARRRHPAQQDAAQPRRPAGAPSCARASSDQKKKTHDPVSSSSPAESQIPAGARDDLVQQLVADGCADTVADAILRACPALTVDEYLQQRQRLRAGYGIGYLLATLRRGQRLPAPPAGGASGDRAVDPGQLPVGDFFRRGDDLSDLDPQLLQRYFGGRHAS